MEAARNEENGGWVHSGISRRAGAGSEVTRERASLTQDAGTSINPTRTAAARPAQFEGPCFRTVAILCALADK